MDGLSAEDAKLVTLARATRARNGAAEGAAVRDETGRTYAASTVSLPSLQISAVQAAVVMAIASGSRGLEAAAVVTAAPTPAATDRAAVSDLGGGSAPLHIAGLDGVVRSTA
ncbi:MAG: cytidine deaminase [Sporichthyaceae bacterium]